MAHPIRTTRTLLPALAIAAGLGAGVGTGSPRAMAADVTAGDSAPARLDLWTSRGLESLSIGAPEAGVSAAQPSDAAQAPFRVRSRVIVRAGDRRAIEGVLAAQGIKGSIAAAGAPDAPLTGFWTVDVATVRQAATLASALHADPAVAEAYLDANAFVRRSPPTDPGFPSQWYLNNSTTPIASVNVLPAWMAGFTGAGVTVGVIDEGFNIQHPDLAANYVAGASQADLGFADHGTESAGLVAMAANNAKGGAGLAYGAGIARLYYGFQSDNAVAFGFHNELNFIKTNSWGPSDNGNIFPMSSVELAALDDAVTTGRGGKGEIVVWAAGNGAQTNTDRVDYDGYGSNRYSIAVGAIDNTDRGSLYSEPGSALMLVTTSSYDFLGSNGSGIYSCSGFDTSGDGSYTSGFGGTSAAAPLVAGAAALILQANPNLGWRDVQHVLIRSARRVNPTDAGWTPNGAGRFVHERFGFGALDTAAAVALAQTFVPRSPELLTTASASPSAAIPDNSPAGVLSSIPIAANRTIERVQVVLSAPHTRLGDLRVVLTSPSGSSSVLAADRNDFTAGYNAFVFTSVRHWDERSHGVWTLRVSDMRAGVTGTFSSWQLRLYATTPACPCDWNGNGLTVSDIFAFLNDWFAGAGDFNNDGVQSVQDIFDFLSCWFTGCP